VQISIITIDDDDGLHRLFFESVDLSQLIRSFAVLWKALPVTVETTTPQHHGRCVDTPQRTITSNFNRFLVV